MDYESDGQMWSWQGEDFNIQNESNLDISHCSWNDVNQANISHCTWNQVNTGKDCFSYMQDDESTPVRTSTDLAHQGNLNKNMEEESQEMNFSQSKRRRMLQFDHELSSKSSSTFLKSKDREDLLGDVLTEWASVFVEEGDISMSGSDCLDQTSEGWLADCLNDPDIHFTSEKMNLTNASDDAHAEVSEMIHTLPPHYEAAVVQEHPKEVLEPFFSGIIDRKPYIKTPMKMASSVIYPFAIIKPCGADGDVTTLKDINQQIKAHPFEKSIQGKYHPSSSYPTSAFSGKPVVGKTRIMTEGGKGSITIMRTKG